MTYAHGSEVSVPTMQDISYFDYKEDGDYEVLERPLIGSQVEQTVRRLWRDPRPSARRPRRTCQAAG